MTSSLPCCLSKESNLPSQKVTLTLGTDWDGEALLLALAWSEQRLRVELRHGHATPGTCQGRRLTRWIRRIRSVGANRSQGAPRILRFSTG
jgi:hypothetical protein